MPRIALTDRFIAGAKSTAPQTDYFDEKTPGLALRVSSSGRKGWVFLYTAPKDGKRARITLGGYPANSLAAGRARALEARGLVEAGTDPRDALGADGKMTVATLVTLFLEKHASALRSGNEIARRLNKNAVPIIGGIALADLHKRDVNRVIDPILKRGRPIEANRVFENMRAMFLWAARRGDLDANPMDGMAKPSAETSRDRVLSDEEIRALWNTLPDAVPNSEAVQRIAKLCLITGQRVGEVAGMRRSELDLKKAIWSLPGLRTKNGVAHTVPLPDMAVTIIKAALADAGDDAEYLFPTNARASEGRFTIDPHAVAKTLLAAQKPTKERPKGRFGIARFTPHDLRRTALTGLAQLRVLPIVIGAIANHLSVTKASVTFANYVQYDYAKEKRKALDLWAKRLAAITSAAPAKIMLMGKQKARAS